jgi:hypothetical protein
MARCHVTHYVVIIRLLLFLNLDNEPKLRQFRNNFFLMTREWLKELKPPLDLICNSVAMVNANFVHKFLRFIKYFGLGNSRKSCSKCVSFLHVQSLKYMDKGFMCVSTKLQASSLFWYGERE